MLALFAAVLGIALAVSARRYTARAVAECTGLIEGSVGSRGTADPRALRDLAIIRYDALNEMSGQLSFSVALLNAAGDGVVISSINGRSETRTYAKVVLGGTGAQELSPEEEQAVRSARLGTGLPGTTARAAAADGPVTAAECPAATVRAPWRRCGRTPRRWARGPWAARRSVAIELYSEQSPRFLYTPIHPDTAVALASGNYGRALRLPGTGRHLHRGGVPRAGRR